MPGWPQRAPFPPRVSCPPKLYAFTQPQLYAVSECVSLSSTHRVLLRSVILLQCWGRRADWPMGSGYAIYVRPFSKVRAELGQPAELRLTFIHFTRLTFLPFPLPPCSLPPFALSTLYMRPILLLLLSPPPASVTVPRPGHLQVQKTSRPRLKQTDSCHARWLFALNVMSEEEKREHSAAMSRPAIGARLTNV